MKKPSQTLNIESADIVDRICNDFSLALDEALKGGSTPDVEEYVVRIREVDREILRKELETLRKEYRRRQDEFSIDASAILEKTAAGNILTKKINVEQTIDASPSPEKTEKNNSIDNTWKLEHQPSDMSIGATVQYEQTSELKTDIDLEVADNRFKKGSQLPSVTGYEILGELGRGGMGVVYKARHLKLNRVVALKMVIAGAHASQSQLDRFLIEAEAVAQLQHPNIVQIHEIGEHEGLPYFSLEFVDGDTLTKKISGNPLPPRAAAEMTGLLAEAMANAHAHGVIHRDLKPANILLTKQGSPKITDFGLAKRLESDSSQTKSGTLMGTPSYMAPEQARGKNKEITPLADVYALGVILYEMLIGRPPFVGTSIIDTLQQVQKLEPVPPRQLVPKVPVDLETICLRCLQKEPHKRYPSAESLALDLRHFLDGEPIEARPIGKTERFYRWCRRNPRVAALSGTVLGLLLTIAITSTVLLFQIAREKKQTELERQVAIAARDQAHLNEGIAKEAQQKAEMAEKLARENAVIAGEQGRLAVTTLYQVVTKVQQRLRTGPGNQKLRIELLNDAFSGLSRVVAGSESSALVSRTKAAAHQLMGDISKELGRTEAALKEYQSAQKIVETLAAAEPDNDIAVWNQAVVYEKLGDIKHQLMGDGAVAREYYRKCLALRTALSKKTLNTPELRPDRVKQSLAGSYRKQGYLALMLGDPTEAWEDYQKYLELQPSGRNYETLQVALDAVRDPKNKNSAFSASFALRLGELAFHLGDKATCRGWYGKAMELSQARVKKEPDNENAKQDLAACHAAQGDLELQTGDAANARDHYLQSHKIFEELRAGNPDSADLQRILSQSHYRLGTMYQHLGNQPDADKQFQAALRLRQALIKLEPYNAYNQIDLALILARSGHHVQAAEQAEKLRTRAPKDPAILFFTASTYSLCSVAAANGTNKDSKLQEQYSKLALDAIAQAIVNGYLDGVTLEHDPDLEGVRKHAGFQELIKKLKQTSTDKSNN